MPVVKVLCIIPTLGHGGAQKVLVDIANNLSLRHQVLMCVFTGPEFESVVVPNANVALKHLGSSTNSIPRGPSILVLLWKLHKLIKHEKPDVVLSFQDIANFPAIAAHIGTSTKLIISERLDPRTYRMAHLRAILRWISYGAATRIVVQTNLIAEQFSAHLKKKIVVIPNACPKSNVYANPGKTENQFRAIAVGRLEPAKGFVNLIEAAKIVLPHNTNWRLDIYGDGNQHTQLTEQIYQSGLERQVFLRGATANVLGELQNAHLFVHSSFAEGFPNAVAEAVATGLPAIAYSSVSGIRELITDKENGLLLDEPRSVQKLAEAMNQLMNDAEIRNRMGIKSIEKAKLFDHSAVMLQWEKLIQNVISEI